MSAVYGATPSTVTSAPSLCATSLATSPSTTRRQRRLSLDGPRARGAPRGPTAAWAIVLTACGWPPPGPRPPPRPSRGPTPSSSDLLLLVHLLSGGHEARIGQPERRSVDAGDGDHGHGLAGAEPERLADRRPGNLLPVRGDQHRRGLGRLLVELAAPELAPDGRRAPASPRPAPPSSLGLGLHGGHGRHGFRCHHDRTLACHRGRYRPVTRARAASRPSP